ncbi:MAG: CaiB/BaiF CoA transferase family protein [Dehalococcoidia bacterium]
MTEPSHRPPQAQPPEGTTPQLALPDAPRALQGLRVIDAGQVLAGPFGPSLLADFGAEVIKVELPGERVRPEQRLNRAVESRNKKSVTLDLRHPEGRELFLKLIAASDAVVENYTPGTFEKWGLGYDTLSAVNPRIILVRVSGYGQDGPYSQRRGYDRIGMAFGGLLHVTGDPDQPPAHPGFMLADYITGMFNAMGLLMAVYNRDVAGSGRGQVIDASLYESIFRLSSTITGEYAQSGTVRDRAGTFRPWSVPANQYRTADDRWLLIIASTDRLMERLLETIGRQDLIGDPRFVRAERAANAQILDEAIGAWVATKTLAEAMAILEQAQVPFGPVNTIADIFADPHVWARRNIVAVPDALHEAIYMPGIVPQLSTTPGNVYAVAPEVGQHNEEIYQGLLHLSDAELTHLRDVGAV